MGQRRPLGWRNIITTESGWLKYGILSSYLLQAPSCPLLLFLPVAIYPRVSFTSLLTYLTFPAQTTTPSFPEHTSTCRRELPSSLLSASVSLGS